MKEKSKCSCCSCCTFFFHRNLKPLCSLFFVLNLNPTKQNLKRGRQKSKSLKIKKHKTYINSVIKSWLGLECDTFWCYLWFCLPYLYFYALLCCCLFFLWKICLFKNTNRNKPQKKSIYVFMISFNMIFQCFLWICFGLTVIKCL